MGGCIQVYLKYFITKKYTRIWRKKNENLEDADDRSIRWYSVTGLEGDPT